MSWWCFPGRAGPENNLPLQLSSLIGRDRESAEAGELPAERRLLALTEPGGSGKTRLALAVAGDVTQEFEDGVWWVALAALSDAELVPQAVASGLGMRERPGRPLTETLREHLASSDALLILDNCEQLVETCERLAGRRTQPGRYTPESGRKAKDRKASRGLNAPLNKGNMMSVESTRTHDEYTSGPRTASYVAAKEVPMKKPAAQYVTLVELLELTVPYEEFEEAVRAATERLEAEGVRELVSVNFYAEPDAKEAGAILIFSDRERMLAHMDMVSSWEEFRTFFATVKPLDVRVYGNLSAEAEAWISQFGDIVSRKFEHHTAGFVR